MQGAWLDRAENETAATGLDRMTTTSSTLLSLLFTSLLGERGERETMHILMLKFDYR